MLIKVVIADDHEIFRDGLVMLLQTIDGIEVVGEAKNGEELVNLVDQLVPDIVLTDIKMPQMDGIRAAEKILNHHKDIGIIALTMFEEGEQIMEMIDIGAMGYLLKNATREELREAIFTVYNKFHYYCKQTSSKIAKMVFSNGFASQTDTDEVVFKTIELEIIKYIYQELTSKEIAKLIGLNYRTVEGYRSRILIKMGVDNMAGFLKYAIKNNLIE
jgi:two-component system, NarL family, response regulator NreC